MSTIQDEARNLVRERPELARAVATLWKQRHGQPQQTNLTARQREVLEFLRSYADEHHGASPTYREIQRGLGLSSVSRIAGIIAALEERGFIVRIEGRTRSLRII